MNIVLKLLSYVGLGLTIVPAVLQLAGFPNVPYVLLTTLGMVLWFLTAPFWINKSTNYENK